MQADGATHGRGTAPRRRQPKVLLNIVAVVVIAAVVALLELVPPIERSGVGVQEAIPSGAGSAVFHDDAGAVHTGLAPGYATIHDDAGNVHR